MEKLKYFLILLLIPLTISCGKKSSGNQDETAQPPIDLQVQSRPLVPHAYFRSLEQSEAALKKQYDFEVLEMSAHEIRYRYPTQEDLKRMAQYFGVKVVDFKARYLEGVFYFSLNHKILEQNRNLFLNYNSELYNSYLYKTKNIFRKFSEEIAEFYRGQKRKTVDNSAQIGISELTILDILDKQISVLNINNVLFYQSPIHKIQDVITNSQSICRKIEALSIELPNSNNLKCHAGELIYELAQINMYSANLHDDLAEAILLKSHDLIIQYNQSANAFLIENAIYFDSSNPKGIDTDQRGAFEREFISSHYEHSPIEIHQALQNNLYENLIFKKQSVQALLELSVLMPPQEQELHHSVLQQIERAMSGLHYEPSAKLSAGTSPLRN